MSPRVLTHDDVLLTLLRNALKEEKARRIELEEEKKLFVGSVSERL